MTDSKKPYTPFFPHRYNREKVEQIFGPKANGRTAQELHQQNPALYRELRAEAEAYGLIGPRSYTTESDVQTYLNRHEKNYSDRELFLRTKYTESEIRELFCKKNGEPGLSAGQLAKDNPKRYAEMREAAVSYGLLPTTPNVVVKRDRSPNAHDDGKSTLSDELCLKANLPLGTRLTTDQIGRVMEFIVSAEQAKAASQS